MERLDSIWHKNSFLSFMLSRVFPNKKPTAQGKGLSSDYNESVMVRNLGSDAAFVIAAGMIITQGYAPAEQIAGKGFQRRSHSTHLVRLKETR